MDRAAHGRRVPKTRSAYRNWCRTMSLVQVTKAPLQGLAGRMQCWRHFAARCKAWGNRGNCGGIGFAAHDEPIDIAASELSEEFNAPWDPAGRASTSFRLPSICASTFRAVEAARRAGSSIECIRRPVEKSAPLAGVSQAPNWAPSIMRASLAAAPSPAARGEEAGKQRHFDGQLIDVRNLAPQYWRQRVRRML